MWSNLGELDDETLASTLIKHERKHVADEVIRAQMKDLPDLRQTPCRGIVRRHYYLALLIVLPIDCPPLPFEAWLTLFPRYITHV